MSETRMRIRQRQHPVGGSIVALEPQPSILVMCKPGQEEEVKARWAKIVSYAEELGFHFGTEDQAAERLGLCYPFPFQLKLEL